jgi:hypothetical protein
VNPLSFDQFLKPIDERICDSHANRALLGQMLPGLFRIAQAAMGHGQ